VIAGGLKAMERAVEASEDDPDGGRGDLLARGFTEKDAAVGITASGRTPYVLGAINAARELGALTIGVSCTPGSELSRLVRIAITPLTGPEVIAGSTRLKAGTATKLVLNMLSTAAMIRLGYVFGNLMVNVQPTNTKLEHRARRIIAETAGVSFERAAELLHASQGDVRTAIVMARLAVDRDSAQAKLAAAGGSLSVALNTRGK
jgi:N-acetylmuramic acid 6-phosphate etherase